MTPIAQSTEHQLNDQMRAWFDGFMNHLRVDRMSLETNTATTEKQDFYHRMAAADATDLAFTSRIQSSRFFLGRLILDYVNELKQRQVEPCQLAMDFSDASVLVWAEIDDDDESMEDQLRLAQAKINAQYSQYGFYLSSTIVEKSDCLSIPSHYQSILK
ncbi:MULTISPECIES: hypothetical protein [unclassified Spirosoma]|uniref:hypothetical protein n=1 Tax=unclassified Spirosoma TaxID=2621999 RepID=UPI000B030164|nr:MULTISPECIES: hypothetical protein [unclassified Spirosoma]MBN8823365.1 hypothetical protein [Spirosoma sp.]